MTTSGILLLDKPLGLTSNQALGQAKRFLGICKAGHTGALDPLATGLLPLCFGEATKVSSYLLDADKTYQADIRLGETTASGDAEGEIVEHGQVPALDPVGLDAVLDEFRGGITQVPPMYSALKHQGRRLHELARQGIEVERKPRAVTIYSLDLLEFESPRLTLRVRCSKGTYIRSLAMDIGAALGCGAHLSALRRTASGPFAIERAVGLDALEAMPPDDARDLLLPPDLALQHLPAVQLTPAQTTDIRHGRAIVLDAGADGLLRMYGGDSFLGVGEARRDGRLQPKRLFQIEEKENGE